MNNRYFIRAVKYFTWLLVLFTVVFVLLLVTKTSRFPVEHAYAELFQTGRGLILLCVMLLISATYPLYGFVRRDFEANIITDRDKILKAFEISGFKAVMQSDGMMVFRAVKNSKKTQLLWEDTINVTAKGNLIEIEGIRKEVVKIDYRLRAFLEN